MSVRKPLQSSKQRNREMAWPVSVWLINTEREERGEERKEGGERREEERREIAESLMRKPLQPSPEERE